MKQIQFKTLILYICLLSAACVTAQTIPPVDGAVIIRNLTLEETNDILTLRFEAEVTDEALNNRQSWSIIPQFISDDRENTLLLPYLLINGRQKERHYKRRLRFENRELLSDQPIFRVHVPQDTVQVMTYRTEIPYEMWMENASLTFHQILTSPRNKKQLFSMVDVAKLPAKEKEVEYIPEPPPAPEVEQPAPPAPHTYDHWRSLCSIPGRGGDYPSALYAKQQRTGKNRKRPPKNYHER